MSILVTGGAGFIGSWVVQKIAELYPTRNVICFDALTYAGSPRTVDMMKREFQNFRFVHGDVAQRVDVEKAIDEFNVSEIIHIAAESHVDRSFADPTRFLLSNTLGTQVLLDCVRQSSRIDLFLYVSTDEVFGDSHPDVAAKEDSLLQPTNPYSASKAAAEMFVQAYRKSWNIPSIIVRLQNVYGPRQYPEKIMPTFAHRLLTNDPPCILHGSGEQTRRYLYIDDAVSAIMMVRTSGRKGETYNFGPDGVSSQKSNLEILDTLLCLAGLDPNDSQVRRRWVSHGEDRPYNDKQYLMDWSKAKAELGWRPLESFNEGMAKTWHWYQNNLGWFDEKRH